jgi:hypothetical protein
MNARLAKPAVVLLVAGACLAPQAHWLLLSEDRHTVTAREVERAVQAEFQMANSTVLDRLDCEPIAKPPGLSLCEAQEADKIFGLVYEVRADGRTDLYDAPTGDRTTYAGKGL